MADTIRRDQAAEAVERAHRELWKRFVLERDDCGIVLDYAGLDGFVPLPTPEECADGKPNALAWWCPAENGAFFNGLYIDGRGCASRCRHPVEAMARPVAAQGI